MNPLDYAAQIAYSSKDVLNFTYEQSKKYSVSPGTTYVECGCAAGAQIIAMKSGAPFKCVYAFDSFEGIPLPSNKDDQMPGLYMLTKAEQMALPDPGKQVLQTSGAVIVDEDQFWENISKSGINYHNLFTVKGWFEETIPKWVEKHKDEKIAILRLDGDLYNSTYVCLKYLYPKVIEGGLIIVDDWALKGCRQAVTDFFFNDYGDEPPLHMQFIKDENSTVAHWIK